MLYQPQISDENVRALYQLKLRTKRPMTRLVNDAIRRYCEEA